MLFVRESCPLENDSHEKSKIAATKVLCYYSRYANVDASDAKSNYKK